MDYGKLSKQALLEMCDAKGIAYSSTFTKDKLIELLFETEKQTTTTTQKQQTTPSSNITVKKDDSLVTIGSILTIISSLGSILLGICIGLYWILLMEIEMWDDEISSLFGFIFELFLLFWSLLTIGNSIFVIITSIRLLRGKAKFKTFIGIWTSLTVFAGGSLIGGILILVGKYNPDKHKK